MRTFIIRSRADVRSLRRQLRSLGMSNFLAGRYCDPFVSAGLLFELEMPSGEWLRFDWQAFA